MLTSIEQFKGEYAFLSNFYTCEVVFEGIVYPSAEHAFQAHKSLKQSERQIIAKLPSPGAAKRAGRALKLRFDWDRVKLTVMERVLRQKFRTVANPDLAQKLLKTHPLELVEGNYWNDKIWGVCLRTGEGDNHLGRLLMKIRQEGVQCGGRIEGDGA